MLRPRLRTFGRSFRNSNHIYFSRDLEGIWKSNNKNQYVIRNKIICEACLLEYCPYNNKCIDSTVADDVIKNFNNIIDKYA